MAQTIQAQIQHHGLDATLFERIDRIAFDFCFETPAEGKVRIFPWNNDDQEVAVGYRIEDGTIRVTPWPFGVDSHSEYLVGYQLEGYPAVLEPVMVPFGLMRLTQ